MNSDPNLDDYAWLTSESGCDDLREAAKSGKSVLALSKMLRKTLPASRVRMILEQVELRSRGKQKFPNAEEMFFTSLGLEQATDAWIAAYKRSRFSGQSHIADLCSGIGGDLVALAEEAPATGFDLDPVACHFSRWNLAHSNARNCTASKVQSQDVETIDLNAFTAWHADPDRRASGKRTIRAEDYAPPQSALLKMLKCNENAAIKFAPASRAAEDWPVTGEWEWISRDRECKQLLGWFGSLARAPGMRVATRCYTDGRAPAFFSGTVETECQRSEAIGEYVFAPDVAIFASHLTYAFAAARGLSLIESEGHPPSGFLTGNTPAYDPLASCFAVEDVLPFDLKLLKAHLHAQNIGQLEIKPRGIKISPESLIRQLKLKGEQRRTLLITNAGNRVVAILATRVAFEDI